jgi:hypothetical protein
VALLNGCAITAVPDQVPAQKGIRHQNLIGVSLVVLSGSQDASPYPYSFFAGCILFSESDAG